MSVQLKKERIKIEKSAIEQPDQPEIKRRGPKPGTVGRPKGFKIKKPEVPQSSVFTKLASTILQMEAHDGVKLELMDAVVQKLRGML